MFTCLIVGMLMFVLFVWLAKNIPVKPEPKDEYLSGGYADVNEWGKR